jgi:phenylacetate-CoA ligase
MYEWMLRSLIIPISEKLQGSSIIRSLRFLEQSQKWNYDELRTFQETKLQQLITHAYKNVPYYREYFLENGLTDKDIRNIEDLEKLPIITKDDIRRNRDSFLSDDFIKRLVVYKSTGGTTGDPLQFYMDTYAWSMSNACNWRGWGFAGYKLGDRLVTLAGSSLIPNTKLPWKKRFFFRLQQNLLLSAVHLSKDILESYVKKIEEFNPQYLRGYPTAFALLAEYMCEAGVKSIQPKAVFTTAEMILPAHRQIIEDAFQCKVFDGYGCADGGGNAMECSEHNGHHFSMERSILEIVKNGDKVEYGETGEFVLTDLHNYAMPFIRYKVGDVGSFSNVPCSCGRSLPLLERIEGRITEVLKFKNGISLSGPATTLIFKDTNFRHYQLVQMSESELLIRVVPGQIEESSIQKDKTYVTKILQSHLSDQVMLSWAFVDELEVSASGKRRVFIPNEYE